MTSWPACSPRPAGNLDDTLFDVPVPAGAQQVGHWEDDGTGCWTRRLAASVRSVERTGADCAVYVDGVQASDGTVQWSLFVVADDREPFTGVQARRFAAMILQAADELDRLAGACADENRVWPAEGRETAWPTSSHRSLDSANGRIIRTHADHCPPGPQHKRS